MNLEQVNRKLSDIVLKRFKRGSSLDNIYIPAKQRKGFICVQNSVEPKDRNFNETFQHIHKEIKKL